MSSQKYRDKYIDFKINDSFFMCFDTIHFKIKKEIVMLRDHSCACAFEDNSKNYIQSNTYVRYYNNSLEDIGLDNGSSYLVLSANTSGATLAYQTVSAGSPGEMGVLETMRPY